MSGTIEKIKAKVENVLHHDKTSSTTHSTGTTHTPGTTNSTLPEGAAGPHGTRVANAADPRVDSDRDHRAAGTIGGGTTHSNVGTHSGVGTGTTHSGVGTGTSHSGVGTHSGVGNSAGYSSTGATGSTTAPHSSGIANKLDPRVDTTTTTTSHNGAGYGASHTGNSAYGTSGSTNAGPHSSNIANTVDPRVDSTSHVHSGTTGYGGTHAGNTNTGYTGTSGGLSSSTNAGPHDSNVANKVDPRVDSDLDGRGNRHGAATGGILGASGSHATPGSGTAQNTAGPHNSDALNKIDPRVDSDRDGSTTIGGNKTRA